MSVAEKTESELRHFGALGASQPPRDAKPSNSLVERRLGDHDAPTEADDGEFAPGDELVAESARRWPCARFCGTCGGKDLSLNEGLEALERFFGLVAIVVAEFKPGSAPRY